MLATLIRQLGDFQLAEDVLQDAFTVAVERWGRRPPERPGAWILTTARRRALDRLRHRRVRERKQSALETIAEDFRRYDEVEGWRLDGMRSCREWVSWKLKVTESTARKWMTTRAWSTLGTLNRRWRQAD